MAFPKLIGLPSIGKSTRNDLITPLILAEVIAHVFAGGVFVFLDLLLYLFVCLHYGFCGDPLGFYGDPLGVFVLHDYLASSRTWLDT